MLSRIKFITTNSSAVKCLEIRTFSTRRSYANLEEICLTGKLPSSFNFARDVFDRHVAERPSNLALWMESDTQAQRWTFAQLHRESIRASIALKQVLSTPFGKPGAPVALVLLPRIPEWWFLHLAAIRTGTVFCPATTQLTPQDIEYRLKASGAKVIITTEQNMWKVEQAQRQGSIRGLRKVVVGNGMYADDWVQYHDLTEHVLDSEILKFKNVDTKSEALAQIFFTSGTTGKPKMVAHSHSSYGVGHCITSYIMQLEKSDIMWNISDPGWAKSSYSSFFAPWVAGSTVYVHQMERVEPQKVLKTLCDREVTTLCAPPTLYRFLVQESDPQLFKFKSLKRCYGAGEAVNPDVVKKWEQKCGLPINEYYGQTETVGLGASPKEPRKEGSIGKIVGFDLRIIDEDGNDLGRKAEGNIAIKVKPEKPIGMFTGYVRQGPDGLEIDTSIGCYVRDYYTTGDRGYLDEDGCLFIVGRSDDVIISAGYRIGPYEVESVLMQHDAVAESAVVAYPDEERGAVVKAFIVLTEEYRGKADDQLVKDIQEFVKNNTAPYKYPRQIEFVEALPKTISGKILRRNLRASATS